MSTPGFVTEIRAVKMSPQHAGTGGKRRMTKLPRELERGQNLVMRGDRCGGRETRRTVTNMGLQGILKRFRSPVHEITAVATMHVEVDETRGQIALVHIDNGPIGGKFRNVRYNVSDLSTTDDDGSPFDSIGENHLATKETGIHALLSTRVTSFSLVSTSSQPSPGRSFSEGLSQQQISFWQPFLWQPRAYFFR
jgi:hypothetical protein